MLIEIMLAILLGTLAGTFTGLFPGIHINLVSSFLVYSSVFLASYFEPIILIVAIVSMAITHTFVDFVPSIFLGAPNEDTALSIMPGHELLMEGRGHEAVMLSVYGCFLGIILSLLFVPIFIFFIPKIYPFFQRMMAWILIWVVILLIYQEKKFRLWAILIFLISGFLGIASLNMNINQPLLPLLSGLFGASALIQSISQKVTLPKQKLEKISIDKKDILKPLLVTSITAPICSFLPGLGSSQAAIAGSGVFKEEKALDRKQFLVLIGMINSFVMAMSFVVVYVLSRARTGAASAIMSISQIGFSDLIWILAAIVFASLISLFLTSVVSKSFSKNVQKISYSKISKFVLILLSIIVFIISRFLGILIFIISSIVGLLCIYSGCRRGFLMGCLLVQTTAFYLFY